MATLTTVNTWPLNGSIQEFDVTFDYLSQTFIKVNLVGPTRLTPLVLGTDYTFVTPTRIRTTLVYGPPTYTTIELRRETSTTERLVEFQDASILHATDLNTDALQVMHVAEEARNSATETIGTNNDGNLDARGRRIVHLANPVDPGDAVSRLFYDTDKNGALVARNEAVAARNGALTSQQAAAAYQTASRASEVAAKASQDAAKASQDAAAASQAAAKVSEDAASASKASAQASSILSMKWAVNPENVEISTGQYSSMHWALKAQAWAQTAASGVLPAGGVKWPMLDTDLQTNRFLPLSGGTLSGGLSVTGGLTAAGVSSTSMTVGGKAVATAESVTGATTRVSTLESTTASLGTRATNLESRAGSLESSTSGLNTRVGSLEAVKPVKSVNWVAPDANGNVNVAVPAGGVPLDAYSKIGAIAILMTSGEVAVAPGATIAGSALLQSGHDSDGSASGWSAVTGTWRMLGYAGSGRRSLYQRIS